MTERAVTRARRRVMRGVTLLASGYEILRPVRGRGPAMGTDALMGKPATGAQMHPPYRLTREVFNAYRAQGWIRKLAPYRTKGWQAWGITAAGREEARIRPEPTPDEIRAARTAGRLATPPEEDAMTERARAVVERMAAQLTKSLHPSVKAVFGKEIASYGDAEFRRGVEAAAQEHQRYCMSLACRSGDMFCNEQRAIRALAPAAAGEGERA